MRRLFWSALLVAASYAVPASAGTEVWVGFPLDFQHAPPPPKVVIVSEPHISLVREVSVVDDPRCDDDMFRYHDDWYLMRNKYWYRAASWRGPWVVVDVRSVPRPIFEVPRERWRHHPLGGPPGQIRKMERREARRYERREDRREERHKDHGKGHDKDHDHDGH